MSYPHAGLTHRSAPDLRTRLPGMTLQPLWMRAFATRTATGVLIALLVLHCLAGCTLFRSKESGELRGDGQSLRSDIVRTGMSPSEVERLLGKPDNVSTGSCTLAGQTSVCQIWRYSRKRQTTLWFSGESGAARLELFDLESLR